jgi:hypothetical protein
MRLPYVLHASLLTVVLVPLLTVVACTPGPTARQLTPTPFTRPTPLSTPTPGLLPPIVTGPLAAAPSDCATVSPPQTLTLPADFGGGFSGDSFTVHGGSPVWAEALPSTLQVPQPSAEQPYPGAKVMWIVGPNYFHPVTLSGREVRSNTPLWFEVYAGGVLATSVFTTAATLDPGAPNRDTAEPSSGHWGVWGIGLLVLSAGCYELDVTWSGGSWRTVYAAGS